MQAATEKVWTAFSGLPKAEKLAILERMLEDQDVREDLLDIATLAKEKASRHVHSKST